VAGTGDDGGGIHGDVRGQIREFLTTRRARITPGQAGLPVYGGGRRRVKGLRREEAALLAGISIEYYTRLERGTATGVSESVIDGITHALQLDEAGRAHLVDLLRTAGSARPLRRRPARPQVRPTVQRVLDSMTGTPKRRSRTRSLRPTAVRPDRGAVHPQPRVPGPMGRPRRPDPHQRRQAPPPSRSRRSRAAVRDLSPGCRPQPKPSHLHRRARVSHARRPEPARQLGRDRRLRAVRVCRETRLIRSPWMSRSAPINRRVHAPTVRIRPDHRVAPAAASSHGAYRRDLRRVATTVPLAAEGAPRVCARRLSDADEERPRTAEHRMCRRGG
jgi:transcriptional regulator with XRE-family HTH domain